MAAEASRQQVLCLYRKILRLSRTWTATDPVQTTAQRAYIRDEARSLFKANANVAADQISEHIKEAEARLEIGIHYNNPYPRLVNFPQSVLTPSTLQRKLKRNDRIVDESQPVYMKSYKHHTKPNR